MKKLIVTVLLGMYLLINGYGQQINISKIELMPNMPHPLEIRDWKAVARTYDSLVFSPENQGDYLPLISYWDQGVIRNEEATFGLPSYVGSDMPTRGEAINMIPALVSASLIGIDKSMQYNKNWVAMIRDFFNPDQGIYVNNPGGKSGDDWWYDNMPNIFFYQLCTMYPETADFDLQFISIADTWLEAVMAMGGSTTPWQLPNMNYRAWNLETMEPLDEGVIEPEAAGAIAWLLYNAYQKTGDQKYRIGAELCLEFLNSLDENPSYELQLPYGIYTAARMNAELGTNYDMEKLANWAFDVGPLREWGAIIGTWNGNDVSGLIGEAQESYPDYAFFMNGVQQFGALVPMVRYDDRFARAIGKWALNVCNASRLFYSTYHDAAHQDNETWTSSFDPNGGMAYEALKENKAGIEGYATGDAMGGGWANTNLALYGSSHAGIFGGIITSIHNDTILQLDLLKTDYYGQEAYPSYLFFNPLHTTYTITMSLPVGSWTIYDATQNKIITTQASNSTSIALTPDEGTIIVLVPSEKTIENIGQKSIAGGIVIDYNNGTAQGSRLPRIKSISAENAMVEFGSNTSIFCTVEHEPEQTLQYQWFVDGIEVPLETKSSMIFKAGNTEKESLITCQVKETNNWTDSASVTISTIKKIPVAPQIKYLEAIPRKIDPATSTTINAVASDLNNDSLSYLWRNMAGDTLGNLTTLTWEAPLEEGIYGFTCKVSDTDQLYDSAFIDILVRKETGQSALIAHYPFNGNANDLSPNKNHGTAQNIEYQGVPDAFLGSAAYMNSTQSLIRIPNNITQQGNTAIAIAFAFKVDKIPNNEAFIVSHGSWQERWKFSISGGKLRFTMKTTTKTLDIDSDALKVDKWYEVVGQYTGTELELYINKKLNAFNNLEGQIANTTKDVSVGQMLPGNFDYPFSGRIDNLLMFSGSLTTQEIISLHEIYNRIDRIVNTGQLKCYPNPASNKTTLILPEKDNSTVNIKIFSISGQCVFNKSVTSINENYKLTIDITELNPGVYILETTSKTNKHRTKLLKTNTL